MNMNNVKKFIVSFCVTYAASFVTTFLMTTGISLIKNSVKKWEG